MNKYFKYLKGLLYIFIPILIFTLILSIFYYSNIINDKTLNILKLITTSLSMLIGGIYIGRKTEKKGYIEGIKEGLIVVILFFIISFLAFNKGIGLNNFIYYIILLSSSTLGSMIGINKKAN